MTTDDKVASLASTLRRMSQPWQYASSFLAALKSLLLVMSASLVMGVLVANDYFEFFTMPDFDVSKPVEQTPSKSDAETVKNSDTDHAQAIQHELEQVLEATCTGEPCLAFEDVEARTRIREKLIAIQKGAAASAKEREHAATAETEAHRNRVMRFGIAAFLAFVFTLSAAFAQLQLLCRLWMKWVWSRMRVSQTSNVKELTHRVLGGATLFATGMILWVGSGFPLGFWPVVIFGFSVVAVFEMLDLQQSKHMPQLVVLAPIMIATVSGFCGAVLSGQVLERISVQPTWSFDQVTLAYVLCLGLGTLLVMHLSIAGFITHALAANFPRILDAHKFRNDFDRVRDDFKLPDYAKSAPELPSDVGLHEKLKPLVNEEQRNTIVSGTEAAHASGAVIQTSSRLAAVNLIVTLIFVALGLEVLAQEVETKELLNTAETLAAQSWMIAISSAGVVSLAVIYFLPMVRVDPYITIAGATETGEDSGVASWFRVDDLIEKKTDQNEVAKFFGATPKKIDMIYQAGGYGAAFHGMVRSNATEWLKTATTVLSPAVAATILTALI